VKRLCVVLLKYDFWLECFQGSTQDATPSAID